MNVFRNIQRVRMMSLFLIMSMVVGLVLPAPDSRAGTDPGSKGKLRSEDSGYRLELTESSSWNDGYVAEAVVANTGEEEIRNWSVVAVMKKGEIVNSWNAGSRVSGEEGTEVVFEPEAHNMILKSGEKTSFGFQVTGGQYEDIASVKLIPGTSIRTDQTEVTWKETGSWDGHKIIEGTITNRSGKTIRDWSLSFDMDGEITNIWNAVAASGDKGSFGMKSCSYNAVLEPGQSATFGFEVSYDTESFEGIRNVRVYAGNPAESGEGEEPQETPGKTKEPVLPTATPAVTTKNPVETKSPEPAVTPAVTGEPEKDDISEDDIEFIQVENRDWNMDMIHANDPEVQAAKEVKDRKIRVTMLDSGINYSKEVDVVMRRNFVEGQDEMNCLFEDGSGHGTAVAEILASDPEADAGEETDGVWADDEWGEYTYYGEAEAEEEDDGEDGETPGTKESGIVSMADLLESGYDWTEGVNPDIELYSGKVLDEKNETTVDRVVEGIEWAIENETDILSLSLGMEKDSEKLHKAIQKAAANGMLIVAAVGDDEHVDYPAAYPEVMAVGMANSMGQTDGAHSEVAAPGDFIVSRGPFDSMQVFSGSSMAVPHVVGLASILWQKDTTKDAGFIRGLIDVSANATGGDENCEYGLIDCSYALEAYEEFEEQVRENNSLLKHISRNKDPEEVKEEVSGAVDNEAEVETEQEIERLHGSWDKEVHKKFVSDKYEDAWTNGGKYVEVLQSGLSFVDDKEHNKDCYGMRDHPWFHGFGGGVLVEKGSDKRTITSNYMTSFRTLVELAEEMRKNGALKKISTNSDYKQVRNARNGIWQAFQDEKKVGSQTWDKINEHCAKDGVSVLKDCRSLLIYGMALHTLGDTFSHSSYGLEKKKPSKKNPSKVKWRRYTHGKDKDWYADNTKSRKLRYESAKSATKAAIKNIRVDPGRGLAGYANIGKEMDAFCAKTQFESLKDMHIHFQDKTGKEKKAVKMKYVKEGYALKEFSEYYEQEADITKKTSGQLKKYLSYVDVDKTAQSMKACALIQMVLDEKMGFFDLSSLVRVKLDGKTILSQKPNGDKIAVLLPNEGEYTVEVSGADSTFTACTVRDGVVYDAIGRKMKKNEADDEDEPDEDEIEVCEIGDYTLSTDCLVKGKVVWFDYRAGGVSIEQMPALKEADVRFRSRESGEIYKAKTKKDGTYQIEVPVGKYDVVYEKGEDYVVVKQFIEIPEDTDLYPNLTVQMLGKNWDDEGCMVGTLYDQKTGAPLSGASIKIYRGIGYYDKDPVKTLVTDASGGFSTGFLNAGAYTFVIRKDGYETMRCYESIIGYVEATVPAIKLKRKE